ncbi:MAG: hypothetical protein GXO36_06625 [Chloroflexi bacterium]|nr:hypothetical protein [Chloroflexota bacterium]
MARRWSRYLELGLLALFWLTVVRNAWACDDAYIYLRSVEQLWAGHGPVWNASWRVQTFTSPLWYGVLVVLRAWIADGYLLLLVSSLLFVGLLVWIWRASLPLAARIALWISWLVSNAFMDYTTSGLETALAYSMLSAGLIAFIRGQWRHDPRAYSRLYIWLAGMLLVRADLVFLVAPVYLALVLGRRHEPRLVLRSHAGAALLLGAWYGFAWVYYGSPFPNPAYAKLFHGLPRRVLLHQGGLYWMGQFLLDPVTYGLALLAAGVLLRRRAYALVSGAGFYAAYLTWIGGDFMAGRFPALLYLWLVGGALLHMPPWLTQGRGRAWALAAAALYGLFFPHTPLNSPIDYYVDASFYLHWGVGDERGRYYRYTSVFAYLYWRWARPQPFFPPYAWSQQGWTFRHSEEKLAVVDSVGMFGYWSGTDKWVIDVWALTDPFLARLPDADGRLWRPGHYERALPEGYVPTLLTGHVHLHDPELRSLYVLSEWATRKPVFHPQRWRYLPAWLFARAPRSALEARSSSYPINATPAAARVTHAR